MIQWNNSYLLKHYMRSQAQDFTQNTYNLCHHNILF